MKMTSIGSMMQSDKPHYDVVIATPGPNLVPEYVSSLIETTKELNKRGLTYHFLNKYSSFVPSAREITATDTFQHEWNTREVGAGKFSYGKIFWIDSDIEWTVDDFMKIYESELDVVSGVYQTHPNGTVAVNLSDEKGRPTIGNL